MQNAYPTRFGRPIPPQELDLEVRLRRQTKNNHHASCYPHRDLGRSVLLRMVKNLASNQYGMYMDVHTRLHQLYTPPITTPEEAWTMLNEDYEEGKEFRTGSLNNPTYHPITEEHINKALKEYREYI